MNISEVGGEDCYDEFPRTIIADVTLLINTAGPIDDSMIEDLAAKVAELRARHDDATEAELRFVESYTTSVFEAARRRAKRA